MDNSEKVIHIPKTDMDVERDLLTCRMGAEAARKQAILLFEKCMMTGKMFDLFAAEENKNYMGGGGGAGWKTPDWMIA